MSRLPAIRTSLHSFTAFGVLRDAVLLGAAVLALVLGWQSTRQGPAAPLNAGTSLSVPVPVAVPGVGEPSASAPQAAAEPRTAQFGGEPASADARLIAGWAFESGDRGSRAVVVVDKKNAKVFVFDPEGTLQGAAPALLGSAVGDHTVPGVGDKPIAQVLPQERTTPAGRFVAEPGVNAVGEDVVWVEYDAAVSMHRVRANVKAERRLQRLASPTAGDNRISFGCINLPVPFYDNVLSPAVRGTGAVVYVLPETQPAAAFFGADRVPSTAGRAMSPKVAGLRPTQPAGGG
jgi:hypothetical protein